jgi:hypothetical protein
MIPAVVCRDKVPMGKNTSGEACPHRCDALGTRVARVAFPGLVVEALQDQVT